MTMLIVKPTGRPRHHLLMPTREAAVLVAVLLLSACAQSDNTDDLSVNTNAKDANVEAVSGSIAQTQSSQTGILKNVSATVYKVANCGCCEEWIGHAQTHGLSVTVQHPADLSLIKDRHSLPDELRSCHTAVTTDGYVFEGHVPAKYVAEFLQNPPEQAIGLAVPGMPVGSPGMEYQDQFMPYQIMQINKDRTNQVYAEIESMAQQL
ncbi:DUF411 domain-containing protein [Psychrobacter sp. Ps6]|uniref:DUF411 domain-containing protein n=1 Tax=Psychrobacter sp. Ps6 TaxID=2790960 RepID=UPI001EDDC8F1|nr:DUF411 domain-containing protein [Psychrobacter sp. Ps6]MCG3878540.1 DUF411 domain-containing protein [Psychrobacter sp. Ps6]